MSIHGQGSFGPLWEAMAANKVPLRKIDLSQILLFESCLEHIELLAPTLRELKLMQIQVPASSLFRLASRWPQELLPGLTITHSRISFHQDGDRIARRPCFDLDAFRAGVPCFRIPKIDSNNVSGWEVVSEIDKENDLEPNLEICSPGGYLDTKETTLR